jgi:hypothetical protein
MPDDKEIMAICRQMLFVWNQVGEFGSFDEAQLAEYAVLAQALTKSARPATPEGIQALATLAMTLVPRDDDGCLLQPPEFVDWLWVFALSSAAGEPERIPLPRVLPNYWPT